MAEVYTVCLLAVVPLGLRLNLRQSLHYGVHNPFQHCWPLRVIPNVLGKDAVRNLVMLKQLSVILFRNPDKILGLRFDAVVGIPLLRFLMIDVSLDDLNIGHQVNHFLLGEQTVRHKCFALVFASRKQEQNKNYEKETLHSESIAHIR